MAADVTTMLLSKVWGLNIGPQVSFREDLYYEDGSEIYLNAGMPLRSRIFSLLNILQYCEVQTRETGVTLNEMMKTLVQALERICLNINADDFLDTDNCLHPTKEIQEILTKLNKMSENPSDSNYSGAQAILVALQWYGVWQKRNLENINDIFSNGTFSKKMAENLIKNGNLSKIYITLRMWFAGIIEFVHEQGRVQEKMPSCSIAAERDFPLAVIECLHCFSWLDETQAKIVPFLNKAMSLLLTHHYWVCIGPLLNYLIIRDFYESGQNFQLLAKFGLNLIDLRDLCHEILKKPMQEHHVPAIAILGQIGVCDPSLVDSRTMCTLYISRNICRFTSPTLKLKLLKLIENGEGMTKSVGFAKILSANKIGNELKMIRTGRDIIVNKSEQVKNDITELGKLALEVAGFSYLNGLQDPADFSHFPQLKKQPRIGNNPLKLENIPALENALKNTELRDVWFAAQCFQFLVEELDELHFIDQVWWCYKAYQRDYIGRNDTKTKKELQEMAAFIHKYGKTFYEKANNPSEKLIACRMLEEIYESGLAGIEETNSLRVLRYLTEACTLETNSQNKKFLQEKISKIQQVINASKKQISEAYSLFPDSVVSLIAEFSLSTESQPLLFQGIMNSNASSDDNNPEDIHEVKESKLRVEVD